MKQYYVYQYVSFPVSGYKIQTYTEVPALAIYADYYNISISLLHDKCSIKPAKHYALLYTNPKIVRRM